jgi:hypothetical protein
MKLRPKIPGDYGELNRGKLDQRFKECVRFQSVSNQLLCSLDYVDHILQAKHPVTAAKKGMADAHKAAKAIKEEFWIPEDKKAHLVMKSAGELLEKVGKSPEGPALARIQKSVRILAEKAREVIKDRADRSCGIRFYETVKVTRNF